MSGGPALRVDGERVSPDRFYATACDPGKSVVVEACAGSGKTWMLVSRIVRLLLAGVEPHHILAITFTRAAAGEMRDRLAGWLADWSMQASVEDRIHELAQREELASIRPQLDGTQVMEHLGIGPGPLVGKALAFLLELRLEEGMIDDAEIRRRLDQWQADHGGC